MLEQLAINCLVLVMFITFGRFVLGSIWVLMSKATEGTPLFDLVVEKERELIRNKSESTEKTLGEKIFAKVFRGLFGVPGTALLLVVVISVLPNTFILMCMAVMSVISILFADGAYRQFHTHIQEVIVPEAEKYEGKR